MAKKYKATVFLLLFFIYGINFAESEPVNCKEIQCPPPEIIENCPSDSILTDKFDLITTLLTTIASTTTTTTTTTTITTPTPPAPTTTPTVKTTTPEFISIKSVNEILYEDENSNETDSIEMTDNTITSQYSTKLNAELFTDADTTNNSITTDNLQKEIISILKAPVTSIETGSSINSTDAITTNNPNNYKTKKPRKHRKKTTKGRKINNNNKSTTEPINDSSTTEENELNQSVASDHILEKRSLRSYQRESIKIVPGGYISYEPQVLHYRQYNNHHKWKRNVVSPETTKLPTIYQRQICCPKKECTCRENACTKPMCVKSDNILVEIEPGSNLPGKCCPKYECIDSEPECLDGNSSVKPYWVSKCQKCQCIQGTKFCYDGCPPPVKPRNCYSNGLQRTFLDGAKWKEDDCTICDCVDGRMDCLTTFCKNPNCKKEIKIQGECCRVCEENYLTTIITTPTTTLATTTEQLTTSLPNYLRETNTINLTTTIIPSTKPESDSIFRVISENYLIVIFVSIGAAVAIAGGIILIFRKCKQRTYEPVKKSESTNSSQTQEKPNGLKSSNSQ